MWYEIEMLILEILLFILGVGATDQEEVLQGCIQNTNFNSRFKALVCPLHNFNSMKCLMKLFCLAISISFENAVSKYSILNLRG